MPAAILSELAHEGCGCGAGFAALLPTSRHADETLWRETPPVAAIHSQVGTGIVFASR